MPGGEKGVMGNGRDLHRYEALGVRVRVERIRWTKLVNARNVGFPGFVINKYVICAQKSSTFVFGLLSLPDVYPLLTSNLLFF